MSIRKQLLTGLLAVGGFGLFADRASAQITLGAGGVQLGGSNGTGIVVPYSGVRNTTIVGQNGAYTPATGTTYSPAYSTPNGGTSYYSPQTGNYYNPNVGAFNSTTAPAYRGVTYPNQGYYGQSGYSQGVYNRGYAAPAYGSYPAGGYNTVAPAVGGFRVR